MLASLCLAIGCHRRGKPRARGVGGGGGGASKADLELKGAPEAGWEWSEVLLGWLLSSGEFTPGCVLGIRRGGDGFGSLFSFLGLGPVEASACACLADSLIPGSQQGCFGCHHLPICGGMACTSPCLLLQQVGHHAQVWSVINAASCLLVPLTICSESGKICTVMHEHGRLVHQTTRQVSHPDMPKSHCDVTSLRFGGMSSL